MSRGLVVQILFVEEDASVWPRAEAFFARQLGLVGARMDLHLRSRLPERAAGFDLVSLDGRGLVSALLERGDLLADLRATAIVNLLTETPGPLYGHLRFLLGRRDEGARGDGLWVFPQSWMAPWFEESLEFPELGMAASTPPRRPSPDRTWERRTARPVQVLADLFPYPARV
jgi:hypothetical protein